MLCNKGHYGTFNKETGEEIGGFIYWNIDGKKVSYWTSNWWLFEDYKDVYIDLYVVEKNVFALKHERVHVKLKYPYTLKLAHEMLGVLEMQII